MPEQIYAANTNIEKTFWTDATKYAASKYQDEPFVSEIAYMMVTLHRNGA